VDIRIRLLGRLEVEVTPGGAPVHLPPKVQELLAYLLLHPGREIRRDALAEAIWGRRRTTQARHSLRQGLWALRAGLERVRPGQELLRIRGEWVGAMADESLWLDVREFEERARHLAFASGPPLRDDTLSDLLQAVDLYRGDLLEGLDLEWCLSERERYARELLAVLDLLMAHFEVTGDPSRAAQAATRSLELDPARESAHRALMRALARLKDRSGALRQYERCESILRREFGAAPDAETRALYEVLRRGAGP
jgi:DNA-binding SARP family transcriptional activator